MLPKMCGTWSPCSPGTPSPWAVTPRGASTVDEVRWGVSPKKPSRAGGGRSFLRKLKGFAEFKGFFADGFPTKKMTKKETNNIY